MPPRPPRAHVVMVPVMVSVIAEGIARDKVDVPDVDEQRHKDERCGEQRVHNVLVVKA